MIKVVPTMNKTIKMTTMVALALTVATAAQAGSFGNGLLYGLGNQQSQQDRDNQQALEQAREEGRRLARQLEAQRAQAQQEEAQRQYRERMNEQRRSRKVFVAPSPGPYR